jgi:hypothetical protein
MGPTPIWDEDACIVRQEILDGRLTEAELALHLHSVIQGNGKPPYNDPVTFYESTHLTRNLKLILENIMGRLTHTKAEVNPIIVLDVGFGGGKTHTLVALYYAAHYAQDPRMSKYLEALPKPVDARIAAISGDECGEGGLIHRDGLEIRTLWGDVAWQLGAYEKCRELDEGERLPTLDQVRSILGQGPVLVLLDELPTYFEAMTGNPSKLDRTVLFLQRLVVAVSEKSDAALVVAIAEDAYRSEAQRAKKAISEAAREAMEEARAHIRRKELIIVPVQEEEVVHILKKRLFSSVSPEKAREAADAYFELYRSLAVPDAYKKSSVRDEIEAYYPFHPALIRVLYERLSTLDRFHRTRGALRLLSRSIRKVWMDREPDAFLIHPFHIDLADEGVLTELTSGVGEERMRNALESDVWRADGSAVAQEMDRQSQAHWGAPLVRRACNTIYLYSLSGSKEAVRGIHIDELSALMVVPEHQDYLLRLRDTVLPILSDNFGYLERRGESLIFVREQTPMRIIERESRDVIDQDVTRIIDGKLRSLFSGGPSWLQVVIFPSSPSAVPDESVIQVAILNPNLYDTSEKGEVGSPIEAFLRYRDDQGQRPRHNLNTLFVVSAVRERLEQLKKCAQRIHAANMVGENLLRYNIPKDRKNEVEEYKNRQEGYIFDYIRGAFARITYFDDANKIKTRSLESISYGDAKKGREILAHYLKDIARRVTEDPLSPEYVVEYAWPRGSEHVSTVSLHEQFHTVAGLIAPTTKELLQQTIKKGVAENIWVLKQGDQVYTSAKPPQVVRIDDSSLLYTPQAAEKAGLLVEKPTGSPFGGVSGTPRTPITPPPRQSYTFEYSKTDSLASGLEGWMKRERLHIVEEVTLRSRGSLINILHVRNLITRLTPDKTVNMSLNALIQRSQSPRFSLSFSLEKEDAAKEEGRSLLDMAWRIKGCDSSDVTLKLVWPDGAQPEAVGKILLSLGSESEPFIASMEAKASRRSP